MILLSTFFLDLLLFLDLGFLFAFSALGLDEEDSDSSTDISSSNTVLAPKPSASLTFLTSLDDLEAMFGSDDEMPNSLLLQLHFGAV